MTPIDRNRLISDLQACSAALEADNFTYSSLIAAIARQVRAATCYRLPPGGYYDASDDPDRPGRVSRMASLPRQQLLLGWTDADRQHFALCFLTAPGFPASGCIPAAWRMYFPREFAPRRGDIAVVAFSYVGQILLPPRAAIVFGPEDYFWRNGSDRRPLRCAIEARGQLCVSNPRIVVLSRELRAQLAAGRVTQEALVAPCATAAGVLESFVAASCLRPLAPNNAI